MRNVTAFERTRHPLVERWGADDLPGLVRARLADPAPGPSIGFYHRRSGAASRLDQRTFLARAAHLATRLRGGGLAPGTVVIVAATGPEPTLTGFLAASLAGGVPSLYPTRPAFSGATELHDGLRRALAAHGAGAHVLVERDTGLDVPDSVPVTMFSVDELDEGAELDIAASGDPRRALHLQSTSGTTGSGKLAVITHHNAFDNVATLLTRMAYGPDDVCVSWLPLYHDMGLVAMGLLPLLSGTDVCLMSPFDFLAEPAAFPRLVSEWRGSFTSMPNFAFDYLTRRVKEQQLQGLDLSSWTRCYCGGEPVDAGTVNAFSRRFASVGLPAHAVKPTYGLAEATLMVTMPAVDAGTRVLWLSRSSLNALDRVEVRHESSLDGIGAEVGGAPIGDTSGHAETIPVVSVGPPATNMGVWLIDDQGRRVDDDDRCGEVTVGGPSVSPGYRNRDGSIVANPIDGFRTGDVGFFHMGELFVLERVKNIIIRNGENYSATVLEAELARTLERPLNDVVVVDSDIRPGMGRVTAIVGSDRGDDHAALHRRVQDDLERFEVPVEEIVFVPRGAIPRTTSGKKQHARIRELLRSGDIRVHSRFDVIAPVPQPEADTQVIDIDEIDASNVVRSVIAEQARRRGVTRAVMDDDRLTGELGFDSLAVFEMAVALEERLDIALPEPRLGELRTVASVIDLVRELRHSPAATEALSDQIRSLHERIPQVFRIVAAQDGRQVLVDGRWVADFASCNYLGLDLHPEVIESVAPAVRQWGVHPSWTRAVASPAIYRDLEQRLANLLGAPDTLVFPTVTLLHLGVLPQLAPPGSAILMDGAAHHSLQEAAQLALARGAHVHVYRHGDHDDLERLLQHNAEARARVIVVDGVYSMSGEYEDLPRLVELAERYDATIYVDDAHGFGIIGESPTDATPYGHRGNGLVRYHEVVYDRVVYVAGLSKAYSSMAAFVTCRDEADRSLFQNASTAVFSGPVPTASLASAIAGLTVNDREGDALRATVHRLTRRLVDGAREMGFEVDNDTGFPIITVILGGPGEVEQGCQVLWRHGILLTPALFPAAPLARGGVRLTTTAANTDAEVTAVLDGLREIARTRLAANREAARYN